MTRGFEGDMYDCKYMDPSYWEHYYYEDCYKLTEIPMLRASDCSPLVDDSSIKRNDSILPFQYNILENTTHKYDQPLYPFCKNEHAFKKENIRKSVESWWKSLSVTNTYPFWFHPYSTEPFSDSRSPYIDINLNYFSNRKGFENKTYEIYSYAKLLNKGIVSNGKIYTNITTRSKFEWAGLLKVIVDEHFVIQGRLHQSKLNGLVRILGTIPNDPNDDCKDHITSELGFIGHYRNGVPSGHCWKGLLGGSWIYGKVDENGDFSGNDIAYINQDVSTAFKGTFIKGVMISAKAVEVIGERCNEEGIKMLEFSNPLSSLAQYSYHFERPTSSTFGDQPHVVDPLDEKYVRLGESSFDTGESSQQNKENGAFANVDIPSGTVFAHNSGYIYSQKEMVMLKNQQQELLEKKYEFYNKTEEDEDVKNDRIEIYKELQWKYRTTRACRSTMDISLEEGQDPSKYRSTRGHKLNHSFSRMNAQLSSYDSARFGIVGSIVTRTGIIVPKGAELFLHYGYLYSTGPRWYKKLFQQFLFGKDKSDNERKVNNRTCFFTNGTNDNDDRCDDYLHHIKNNLLLNAGVTSEKEASNKILDTIIKTHQDLASSPIKWEAGKIKGYENVNPHVHIFGYSENANQEIVQKKVVI